MALVLAVVYAGIRLLLIEPRRGQLPNMENCMSEPQPADMVEVYLERVMPAKSGLASLWTDGVNEFWLPESIIQKEHIKDRDYKVSIPEWKAKNEGII
jgi:hypothetical protein